MATATNPPRPLPPPDVPIINPKTGRIERAWFDYLQSIDALIRALRLEIP